MKRLEHRDIAARCVLHRICGDPGDEDASRVRCAGRSDRDTGRHRIAEGLGAYNHRRGRVSLDSRRKHRLRGRESGAAVVRDVDPDLARSVEIVVHHHVLGMAGIGVSGDPVTVDAKRTAARGADRSQPRDWLTLRPGLTVVDRLKDVRLQRQCFRAPVQVAQIHGAGLVGGQTVVPAVGVGSRDLRPARSVVRRPIGDRAAAWRADVEPARVVGHDRRLAAVRSDVGDRVARCRCAKDARRQPDRGRDHGSNAGSS